MARLLARFRKHTAAARAQTPKVFGEEAGFTDANAKWLTPKLPSKAALRAAEKEAAAAMQAAEAGAPSDGGSDSEDVPLPGELDAGDSDIGLESPSGSEDEGGLL